MVGEALAGLSAFKAMFDMAKALKDINDAAIRNGAVIELQEKILAAREAQSTLLERIHELEEKVASFEKWETEKDRYELKDVGWGGLAYMLKPDARGSKPPHLVCTNCYGNRRIEIVQTTPTKDGLVLMCPACQAKFTAGPELYSDTKMRWLD